MPILSGSQGCQGAQHLPFEPPGPQGPQARVFYSSPGSPYFPFPPILINKPTVAFVGPGELPSFAIGVQTIAEDDGYSTYWDFAIKFPGAQGSQGPQGPPGPQG